MTIDEAIAHEKRLADGYRNDIQILKNFEADISSIMSVTKQMEYHEQLAEWLEELKDYRDKNKMVVRVYCENMDSIKDKIEELSKYAESQYNKAIDDFAEKLKAKEEELFEPDYGGMCDSSYERSFNNGILALDESIDEIAEQLKAGRENEV